MVSETVLKGPAMSGNVIKVRADNGAPAVPRITREVHEASLSAKEILARAEERAAMLVSEAERARDAVLAENAERGYAAGLDQWNDALVEAWKLRDAYLQQHETELVKLAVAVAGKIVGRSIQLDAEVVLQTVREAMKSVRGVRRITVKVNPAEEDLVRQQAALLKVSSAGISELEVVGLASIEAGGCVVESDLGIIDAQISTQLTSLERALLRRSNAGDR